MTNPTDNQTPQPVDELDELIDAIVGSKKTEDGDRVLVPTPRQEAKARLLQWKNKAVDGRRLQKDEVYEIDKGSSFKGTILADDEPVVVMSKSTFLQWGTRQKIAENKHWINWLEEPVGGGVCEFDLEKRNAELQASLKDGGNDE